MKNILLLLLFSLSFCSHANTSKQIISKIQVESGHVYIFSSKFANTKNCERSGLVKLDKDLPGFKEMYSMALTAFTTKTPIGFWVLNCGLSPWRVTVPIAYASYLSE
ncbi:hypothetical protein GCM10007906_44090 [Vibrio hyugaensis]|uniref:Uncharacterized protein n=1 Tax=Vibrio hyugaensis TaxID=1534743 RepID=A0ABQ5YBP2_9VIBR|nr:hypothetical protein [Vibrio hyugaensis]GLR06821.1 hypothetical protein GCM10007906_44090 [Vibrio hyugaensis]